MTSTSHTPTPAIVWVLTACVAIVGANALTLGPVAPAIAADFSESTTSVLRASAGYGIGTACGALFLARYIDNTGARVMLRLALTGLLAAFVVSSLARHSTMLIGAQFIAGLAAGITLPACYSVAASVAARGDESRILGIVLTGWTISLVGGVTISALLTEWLHWRVLFVVFAALAGLVMMTAWNKIPQAGGRGRPAPSPLQAWRVAGVPALLFRVGFYMIAFYGVYAYLGDHVVLQFGRGVSANAWLAASYGTGFGIAVFLDSWLDRLGSRRAISLSLLVLALVYVALAWASSGYSALLVLAFLWGVVNHLAINTLIAALGAADPNQRGTILGLYSATTYLCMSIATLGFGFVYESLGFAMLCYIAAVLCTLAAINHRTNQL